MQPVTTAPTAIRVDLSEAICRALETFARVSLGLIFFLAGLDGFIDVLPHPSRPLPARALLFAAALLKSGYFLPMLKGTELIAGAAFLSNRFVPLAVALMAPVVLNILAFHVFLAPDGVALALILVALEAYLAWRYRRVYRPIVALPGGERGPGVGIHARCSRAWTCPAGAPGSRAAGAARGSSPSCQPSLWRTQRLPPPGIAQSSRSRQSSTSEAQAGALGGTNAVGQHDGACRWTRGAPPVGIRSPDQEDAMKARRRSMTIPFVLAVLGLALSCATSKELPKYTDSQTVTATAVVQAIDLNTREVTLKGENGNVVTFVAGDQVRNLSQVRVGDTVKATYTESVAIEVKPADGGTPGLSVAATGVSALPGEKPAGSVGRTVTASAVILAIDRTTNRVTLRGPSGNERVVQVKDPKNLENVQVGDMVYATYTESLGLAVEPVAPAK